MSRMILGAPTYSDVGVLYTPDFDGGDWESALPLTNLQSQKLHAITRSSSASEVDTRFECDLKADRPVRVVAIPKHSLSSAGQYRFTGRSSADLFSYIAGEDIAARGGVFARTGTATFVDRGGVVRTAATGVPRDGHWVNGQRTTLLEPASTNLCIRSEEFDTWTDTTTTVTANAIAAPDGTTTADLLTPTDTTSNRRRAITFTGDGEKCAAFFLKAGTSTRTTLQIRDDTVATPRHSLHVTWTGGVPSLSTSNGTGTLYPVESLGNGWWRILFSATGVIAANTHTLRINPDTLVGTGTVYAWGAQAENAVVPSSYIKTEGTTVTRNADSLYFPFTAPPQAMTVYHRQVHRGAFSPNTGLSRFILAIGNAGITGVRFNLRGSSADNALGVSYNDGTTTVSSFVGGGTAVAQGDLVESRAVLRSDWTVIAGRSINGGTEAVSSTSSASGPAGAFAESRLYLAGTSTPTAQAVTHVLVAAGEQSLSTMRDGQYDSGWKDALPSGLTAEDVEGLNHALVAIVPEDYTTLRYIGVQLSDPDNPAGYVDLHRLMVCGGFQPTINFEPGSTLSLESATQYTESDGGATIVDARPMRRVARVGIQNLPENEALTKAWRTQKAIGTGKQCFVVLNPDATDAEMIETAFLARTRELSAIEFREAAFRTLSLAFTEDL